MKKKTKVLALCGLCAAMGLGIVATAGATMGFDGVGILAAKHDASHVLKEKAYEAPQVGKEGYKPYWHCAECCVVDSDSARYDFVNKDTNVALGDIVMDSLTAATEADIAEGDEIGTINVKKFKYVDQGVNGVDGAEGTSTPLYIKDSGKTALFFSRSGKTGEAYNATTNKNCSEFRFSPTGKQTITSVTFSYRYLDYGKGVWAGESGDAEPAGWHSMIQFKDGTYYGKAIEFQNDDTWHEITLNYKDWESAGSKDATSNFSDLIIKFVDLRGHFMVSGLKFNVATVVTLKNVTADGTDTTAVVKDGAMPDDPTMEGKTFLGWYDEEGNKVTSVTGGMTLVARYKQEVSGVTGEIVNTFNMTDETLYSKPEDCVNFWSMRHQNNFADDEASTEDHPAPYYQRPDAGSYVGYNTNSASTDTVGVTLPVFDFSAHNALTFTFGGNMGHDGDDAGLNSPFIIDGNTVGYDVGTAINYTATLRGQTMSVYNKRMNQTFTFTLNDDVYTGKKGLTISTKNDPYRWLLVSSYKELAVDYFAKAQAIEAALPETPTKDNLDDYNDYLALRKAFTAYEAAAYPISTKMQTWADAMPKVIYSFDDNGLNSVKKVAGTSLAIDQSVIDNAKKDKTLGNNVAFNLGEGYFLAESTNAKSYCSIQLPAINFSEYKTVSFAFGFGGNCCGNQPKYAFGLVTEEGITDLANASNYIGAAPTTSNITWDTAQDTVAVISNGKITFNGSNTIKDKTFDLSEDVNNGTAGLILTIGNSEWEYFALSPFTGSKI